MTKALDFDIDEAELARLLKLIEKLKRVKEVVKMKFEYLQVYLNKAEDGTLRYLAFDGNSVCDGDKSLIVLLNKLGQDRWEYCQYVADEGYSFTFTHHLLKRSIP